MSLDKQRIKNIRETLELPNSAKFCGYVIHIPENDEFIARINENGFSKVIGYSSIPDYAIKFRSYEKALKMAQKCNKYNTIIGFLFDVGEQQIVSFEE